MEDIRIYRKTWIRERSVTVTNVSPLVLFARNPKRVAIEISNTTGSNLWISTLTPAIGTAGIRISGGGSYVRTLLYNGNFVTEAINAILDAASGLVQVVETFLEDK